MPYRLSPSSLSVLENCPRCFWLQVVKKIPRPSGAFPSLPSGVDRLLKQHFDWFMAQGTLPPELARHGISDCTLFSDIEKLKLWRNNFKGIQYADPASGVVLHGAVDNLLVKGDALIVLDYKTRGFPVKEDTAHHYQDQMDIYTFLLRKNNYKTEGYAYLLFYMPERILESGEFVFTTELIQVPVDVQHAEALFQKAIRVLQDPMPQPGESCAFCAWKNKEKPAE